MSSILAPIAAAAFKNDNLDYYGAVEFCTEHYEPLWKFDATETELETARLYQDGNIVKQNGFRPASVERLDNGLTLICGWRSAIWADEDGDLYRRETHEAMNDAHEVQKTDKGTYLVASTGADKILEFDEDWNLIWEWKMWEHTPESSKPAGYYPDKMDGKDVRDYALSPDDRYHLNYATYITEDTILVSALNYGVFVVSKQNGSIIHAVRTLDECHNPRQMGELIVVAESGADRIVTTGFQNETDPMFDGDLSFPKDADPIPDSEDWLVTDTKNNRVLIWGLEEGEPKQEFFLGEDAKPYEADWIQG